MHKISVIAPIWAGGKANLRLRNVMMQLIET